MTPNEFKNWRKGLKLKQQDVADAFETTVRAVQMWEAGDRPISRVVALACAAISAGLSPVGSSIDAPE
ncbi:helix-turn-helix domain-containing protein [Azospirillum brasilense]|uniref:helix-turn-helix domain-containing protein n=1 Tax=Azospirillum brasilense TaxID=192 RepID=UPI00190C5D13|nr:helix-turn-helix domain-containing protein [Azospirillum brasilense]MBK3735563.1 helix-turn-helix domain-containing protein [Azospirillum brasilense]